MTPQERTDAVLEFCSDGAEFTSKDISDWLELTPLQARRAIHPLVESGKILAQGNTRARTYRIKRKRARYGLVDTVTAPTGTITAQMYIDGGHGWGMQEATAEFTPQNRPSKWQRIVAFLKGE